MLNVRLFLLLLVCAATAFAGDDEAERCRRLLTFMVQSKGALTVDDLRAFAAAPRGSNPALFASFPADARRLPFERLFNRALTGSEGERVWKVLHEQAKLLLDSESKEAARRDAADSDTEALALPILRKEIGFEERPYGAPVVFAHQGKSFAAFGIGRRSMLILELETLASRSVDLDGPYPVAGEPRYLASPGLIAYTGTGSSHKGFSRPGLGLLPPELGGAVPQTFPSDPITEHAVAGLQPFEHDGKLSIVTIDHRDGSLAVVPIGGGAETVRHFAAELADVTPAVISRPGISPLIAVARKDGKGLRIIDPSAGTEHGLDPKVGFKEFSLFARDGKATLLLTGDQGAFTVDPILKNAEPLLPTATLFQSRPFERAGAPYVALVVNGGVVTVNLETRVASAPIPAPDISTPPRYIVAKGREFLVWGNKSGALSIVDLEHPEAIIHREVAAGGIKDIVPFVTPRGFDALVTRQGGEAPYVAQLFGPVVRQH